MTTQEVADRLVQLCREGKNLQAIDELYSDTVISKEPKGMPVEITHGKDGVIAATKGWEASVEWLHAAILSDPIVAEHHFAITMDIDATYKDRGRQRLSEVCVYEVQDGKIVYDEFFFKLG